MSIITFIIIISALVFVHELGHFLVAKKSGIRVDEFAIGFPPKIFSFKRGETVYSVNLIPFGGFVKIFGENPDEDSMGGQDNSRSFINKPRHIQAAVLVAGILFNIIFAWILFSGSYALGVATEGDGPGSSLYITNVVKGSPAEKIGLHSGDIIKSLSVNNNATQSDLTAQSVQDIISSSKGKEVTVQYSRAGKDQSLKISPQIGIVKNSYAIGIEMAQISTLKLGLGQAIVKGAKTTFVVIKETIFGLYDLVAKIFSSKADFSQVAGPIGIVSLVGQASQFGFGYLLSFTALISINLAVINLIPFPALDGGRLLFVGIEAIRRKSISPKITNTLNIIGFALLIIFMITVTISDIGRLMGK